MRTVQDPRGCGGTLRLVTRDLAPDELPWFATAGQTGHMVCEHPDGTVHEYAGIPTPGEQLAHEFPQLGIDGEELCACLCTPCSEYAGCAACPDCHLGCTACGYPYDDDNYEGMQHDRH